MQRPPRGDGAPVIMGVVNVTPDSFSDGGQHPNAESAIAHGLRLLAQGARVLDIGGESTRPGAAPVSEAQELKRVIPVIAALRAQTQAPMSIDTMKPAVARAAVAAGATLWNDVTALRHAPESLETAAELGVDVILMHMQGAPQTMQDNPRYDDVVGEVIAFLNARVATARAAGVVAERLWVDPGIGFGKTLEHNLALIRALPRIVAETGRPLVFGASRKRFIAALDDHAPADRRLGGSIAAALAAAAGGAAMIRVHDVAETAQALKVWRAVGG